MSQTSPTSGLMYVLDQLPRDVLRSSIWLHLGYIATPASRFPGNHLGRSFRLASKASRTLADQLTRRLSLQLLEGEGMEGAHSSQAAFLWRQAGLEELRLDARPLNKYNKDGECEVDIDALIQEMLLPGPAACHHMHSLCIWTPSGHSCSGTVGQAIQRCCPRLRELEVIGCSPEPDFCAALKHCPDLHKATLGDEVSHEMLAALAALGGLKALHLRCDLWIAVLPALAAFTGLAELCVDSVSSVDDLGLGLIGRTLSTLTQLTQLKVPVYWWDRWHYSSADNNWNVAQLGGLTNLVTLSFGRITEHIMSDIAVTQAAFAALLQLPALTSLSCPAFSPQLLATSGHLPQLQTLRIEECGPARLAATLRPLLPLPSLRELWCWVNCTARADPCAGDSADAPGAAAAAAWQVACALAKAPHLTGLHVEMSGDHDKDTLPDDGGLSASQSLTAGILSAIFAPLGSVLTHLRLRSHAEGTLDAAWPLLCLATRLQSLELFDCYVSEEWLLEAVGQHLGALRCLVQVGCEGVSADTVVKLARVRAQPLSFGSDWDLDVGQQQEFWAVARPGVTLATLEGEDEYTPA